MPNESTPCLMKAVPNESTPCLSKARELSQTEPTESNPSELNLTLTIHFNTPPCSDPRTVATRLLKEEVRQMPTVGSSNPSMTPELELEVILATMTKGVTTHQAAPHRRCMQPQW